MEPGEKYLKQFQPPALPPDLKAKILKAAKVEMGKPAQAPDRGFFSTRTLWLAAAAMLVALAANFIADSMLNGLGRSGNTRPAATAVADERKPGFGDRELDEALMKRMAIVMNNEMGGDERSNRPKSMKDLRRELGLSNGG
jgi:hypothetical protein